MPFLSPDRINYTPAPGGTTTEVNYNNDGVLDGANRVLIDDEDLVVALSASPIDPPEDSLKLFGASVAGKMMLGTKDSLGAEAIAQPFLANHSVQLVKPNGDGTTVTAIGTTLGTVGTVTAAATATTNIHTISKRVEVAVTTPSTSAVAGLRTASLQHLIGSTDYGGFLLVVQYGPSRGVATSTHRSFCGMWGSASAPTDVDPSTLTDMLGFGYDDDDANFQFMHNDASGTATKVNLGVSFPKPTADTTKVYEATIYVPGGGPDVYYQFKDVGTGTKTAVASVAANIPAITTLLRPVLYNSVGGTSSVIGVSLMSLYLQSSY